MFKIIGIIVTLTISSFAGAKTTCSILNLESGEKIATDREVKINNGMGGIGVRADGSIADIAGDDDFKKPQIVILVLQSSARSPVDVVELIKITDKTEFNQQIDQMGNSGFGSLDSAVGVGINDVGLNLAVTCKNSK